MNKKYLYITASLMVLSFPAQAEDQTCAELGYTVPVSECLGNGGMPLLCPLASGGTDDDKMSLCYSDACRGYPLWKEDNTYYHLDRNGNKVAAAPEGVNFFSYVKGGEAALLSCTTGPASDARTYYKVEKCIDGAILDYDVCANGCGKNKYPYDKHPGDLAGAVASCEDAEGEHFGYTSCNDGWYFNEGQCLLSSCDIAQYPYLGNPNLINDEYRGETKTCRIGGNVYYRYLSCDNTKIDGDGKPIYELRKGVCVKRCEFQNCTSTPVIIPQCIPVRDGNGNITSYNSCTYNDWSCELDSSCRVGDFVTYNNKDVGIIYHLKNGESDRNYAIAFASPASKKWGNGMYENVDIPTLAYNANPKTDFNGKKYTTQIVNFTDNYQTNYPSAGYCYDLNVTCPANTVCAQHEWYLPAIGEMSYMHDSVYIVYNASYVYTYISGTFWSSCESGSGTVWLMTITGNSPSGNLKSQNWPSTFPILAF